MKPCDVRMMFEGRVVYCEDVSWVAPVFRDRWEGGERLASLVEYAVREGLVKRVDMVFAVPAGGVPVAIRVAERLGAPLDLVIVKKVTYPWTTEAGFGAVAPDGKPVVDELVVEQLGSTVVERQVELAVRKVEERLEKLRGSRSYPSLQGMSVLVVDDGIAAGWTMIAAVRFLRSLGAERVYAAAPTASLDGAQRVSEEADRVLVVNLRGGLYFAVADAYVEWRDLEDDEVLEMLRSRGWRPGEKLKQG